MSAPALARPVRIEQAVALLGADPMARVLAGGQSLLPAMRLELASPSLLVDLSRVKGLDGIRVDGDVLEVGAMVTHASIAASALVRECLPGLATLASGIADAQVRNLGTIGGSLANDDPAACLTAGVLASGATLVTDRRHIAADDFFEGLFTTALQADELLIAVRFPLDRDLRYAKFDQPASRFALAGVAIAWSPNEPPRVAITGSPDGVFRAAALEVALGSARAPAEDALRALLPVEAFGDDLHASAAWRAQLARVLTQRLLNQHQIERPRALPGVSQRRPSPGGA